MSTQLTHLTAERVSYPTYPRIAGSYLVLELSNVCNLTCVHCAVSESNHPHHSTMGHLDVSVVDALIEDMVTNKIHFDVLILFWLGEPLLHPKFTLIYRRLVRAIWKHGIFTSIEVHTNSILLDAVKRRVLLNRLPVPQKIHCTIDAFLPETYQAIKGRNVLHEVNANVESLLRDKSALGTSSLRIVLQYIVGSNNVAEVSEFHRYWTTLTKSFGLPFFVSAGQIPSVGGGDGGGDGEEDGEGCDDGIFFRQLDCPTEQEQHREGKVFVGAMQRLGVYFPQHRPVLQTSDALHPCSGFWKSPTIDWQGNLTMCTRDNALQNGLGNIVKTPFSKLWWGQRQRSNREQVSHSNYDALSLCQTCFVPNSCNHSTITPEEIQGYQSTQVSS
jgi:radical SAM protein with 4Fe4S-binding SPASM domain